MENKEPVHVSKIIKRLLTKWIPDVSEGPQFESKMPTNEEVTQSIEERERERAAMRMRWMHK